MKKLSFFLMAMLISMMSFAAESLQVTLDFSKNTTWGFPNGSGAKTTATKTYTNGDYSITLAGGGSGNGHYWNNQGYLMLGKSGATLTLPAFDFNTTKIVVVGRTGASASTLQNIYVGSTAVSTQTKGSAVTNTYAIAKDYQAAGNVYIFKVSSSHNSQIVKIEIYGEEGGEQGEKVDAPKFSVTETNFKEAFDLTISSAEGTTLKYTTDNTDPKTSATAVSVETNTANVAIPAKSTVVKAVAVKGDLVSVVASTIYAYVNSPETAYTVAEAMEVIDAGLGLENELYVKGEISLIEKFDATYGSITYWIKDEEGNKFECYSGLGLNKAKFTKKEDLVVGSKVVVCGIMKKYNTTYEFNYNNYIVSLELPVVNHTITVSANPAEGGVVTGGGEFEETDEITVKAVANENYVFVNWTENDVEVSTEAEYTFEVLADRDLVANFQVIPCTQAIAINWDAPIAAEANTDQWYAVNVASAIAAGKDLALTVTNPGTEAVEITIEAYADCPATELIVKSTKTFNAGETKTTTVKYDEYLADQVEVVYLHVVTSGDLTIGTEAIEPCSKATPINWNDPIAAAANIDAWYAVNVESAIAAGKDLALTVSNPSTEAVEITAEAYANCPATEKIAGATSTIAAGATKTTTIKFDEFLADQVDVVYFHVITKGGEIKVEAETVKFNVTATAENGTVEGAGVYEQGAEAILTATAAEGYEFVNWTVAGEEVSTENPYKFTVTADVALVANFKKAAPAMETVYFINNKSWSKVNTYAWEPVQNAGWPGKAATKEAEKVAGYDVYSYTAEVGKHKNVIFNNGSSQTADLKWTAGKYYWMGNAKNFAGATKEEAEAALAKPVEYESVYFVNAQGWAKVNIYTWSPEVGTWPGVAMTKEAEQLAGYDVYSYKVEKGTSFGGMLFNNGSGTQTGDLQWTAGKYYVKDGWYTKEEAEAKLAGPVVTTWTMVGDKALFGTDWDLNATANDLVKQEDGSWVLTLTNKTLAAKSYEYKAAKDRSWTTTVPGGNNAKLTISKAGQYDITFTLNAAATSVTAKATYIPAKYNVTVTTENGTVTGAGEYEEGATATLTATAAEGYEFVNWTVGEEVVSTENPYSFVVTADVALVANFEKAKPEVITYELNGGEFPAVVVPTNAELWEAFKPYYNTYYGLARADQPIDKVSTFANAKMQEIMTDEASEYKWLGDYVQSVATAAGVPLSTDMASANEGGWRWAVHAFFNAAAGQYGAAGIDFTEAGKQEVWGAAYEAEYGVVLPTEPVAEDYVLPTPTKEGYIFVGWYDNAEGTGEPYKVIPAGWAGTLYAIWEAEAPAVEYTEIVMSNLVVTPYGEYDVLEASDAMTGIAVMLGVDADGKLVEGSEVTWNGTSMTIVSSDVFTKTYSEDLATDVYNGKLVIEFYGEEMGLDLYMYGTGAASSVDVVITDANITVDEWGSYLVSAPWEDGMLTIEVSDTEYEGFMMIEYTITEDDWYIWMAYTATVTTVDNVMTIEGEFTDNYTGTTYNVTISGNLPNGTGTGLEDATVTIKAVKKIQNGQLIIEKDGVQYNANGAQL